MLSLILDASTKIYKFSTQYSLPPRAKATKIHIYVIKCKHVLHSLSVMIVVI